jgi:hypothetical protein
MSSQTLGKAGPKPLSPADVIVNLRDLIVFLHRGNVPKAESIASSVAGCLSEILSSGADPKTPEVYRAQQTSFAIEEVRTLLAQRDLNGAAIAARDAAKEWKQKPTENPAG